MTVKIKRNTGFFGMMANYRIYINGEKNKKIGHKETVELDILDENTTVQVRQQGMRSNKVEVSPGDNLEFKHTFIGEHAFFALILFNLLISIFVDNLRMRSSMLVVSLILMVLLTILMFVEGVHVKLYKTSNQGED